MGVGARRRHEQRLHDDARARRRRAPAVGAGPRAGRRHASRGGGSAAARGRAERAPRRGRRSSSPRPPASGIASATSCSAIDFIWRRSRPWRNSDWIVGDLGCGTGQVSAALAPFVARVIAVDASAAMLQAARKRLSLLRQHRPAPRRSRSAADRRRPARSRDHHAGAAPCAGAGSSDCRSRARAQARRPPRASSTCCRTTARSTASRWGIVWLGFPEDQVRAMLAEAGFDDVRIVPLAPDSRAKGPGLFAATAVKA